MKKTFYSNGKLLITGEYLVLDGAKALALPTKYGQNLTVENGDNKVIEWKSFDFDGTLWFENTIPFLDIVNKHSSEKGTILSTLIEILHETYLLNPNFINQSNGYLISTHLTFPKFWGLGTSSTLINNIAQWNNINAFTLLQNSFGGSGYDIACAQNNIPLVYQLINNVPQFETIHFQPKCIDTLYFVYLNKKQNSKSSILDYNKSQKDLSSTIPAINAITDTISNNPNFDTLCSQFELHEEIISHILKSKPVKETLFPDFEGTIKSLGAWGGDFVLVVSKKNPTSYFEEKGYSTIVPYQEMIL